MAGEGQLQHEGTPAARSISAKQLAAVESRQLPGDGKAQAKVIPVAAGLVCPVETFKDALPVFRRDAGP